MDVTVEGKIGRSPEVLIVVGIEEKVCREDVDVIPGTLRGSGTSMDLGGRGELRTRTALGEKNGSERPW